MMLFLAYLSILFVGLQLINVLLNFVFRQKLRIHIPVDKEIISVLIPARNEEENIRCLLSDLKKINNHNLEILVFDDQSTDNTAKIVQRFSEEDTRIRTICSYGLPEGWLGKNHACFQLAQKATGNHYLFIDADVRINGRIIEEAVTYLKIHNLGLLSIFPTQILKSLGEKISVPIMNYILLTLLPLIFVRVSPFRSHAAANGQFMMFDAENYNKIQPHMVFKNSAVEDISIARYYKKQKIKIACLTGEYRVRCRMYKSYKEAFLGFSKNVFMFFGNIPLLAFLFWLFATLGFVPVLCEMRHYFLFYISGIVLIQFFYSLSCKQDVLQSLLFYPFHLIFLLMVMVNAVFVKRQKKYIWKERNIY